MAMSRKVRRAAEMIGEALELPPATLSRAAHIDMNGNREALIDGCRGVIEYGEEMIKVNTGSGPIKFCGRSLELKSLSGDQAVVCGYILSVEFGG